jgi:hypothetical protein
MIHSAYLRVYVPRERAADWRPHTATRHAPRLVRADDRFVWQESTADDAFTVDWGGRRYVCPRFPRLRMLEGLIAFTRTYPGDALIPARAVRNAEDELARLRYDLPRARSHILTSPWHVPLRWFAAFDPTDRELYEASFGLSIRYRAAVDVAADRVARAVRILEEAGFDDAIVAQVEDLHAWLEEFSGDGMVELDYAAVGALFSEGDLVLDESAADVGASLAALAVSDYEQAGVHYAAVATRWAPAQALTYVN